MPFDLTSFDACVFLRCSSVDAGVLQLARRVLRTVPEQVRLIIASARPAVLERALAQRVTVRLVADDAGLEVLLAAEAAAGRAVVVMSAEWSLSAGWYEELLRRAHDGVVTRVVSGASEMRLLPPGARGAAVVLGAPLSRAHQRTPGGRSKDVTQRTLSAVLIVKDEQDTLPASLAALVGVVDEVVVYDTGSTDATVDVARQSGATVIEGYWDDDFGSARNRALEHATGDWVLSVDADEVLDGDVVGLRASIDACRSAGMLVEVVNVTWNGGDDGLTFRAPRLFRRRGAQWSGALHEQVVSLDGSDLDWAAVVPPVRLLHSGYTAVVVHEKDKASRNVDISRAALARLQPGDPAYARALSNLGRSLVWAGEPDEGLAALEELLASSANDACIVTASRVALPLLLHKSAWADAERWIQAARASGESPGTCLLMEASVLAGQGELPAAAALLAGLVSGGEAAGGADVWGVAFPGHRAVGALAQLEHGLGNHARAHELLLPLLTTHAEHVDVPLLVRVSESLPGGLRQAVEASDERFLARSLRALAAEAPRLCLAWCEAFADARPGDVRPVVAASIAAPRVGWEAALRWTLVAGEAGLSTLSPLQELATAAGAPPMERCMAWALLAEALDDRRALGQLVALLEAMSSDQVDEVLRSMSRTTPRTLGQLVDAARGAQPVHA
ncbi:glycosyltransferase family 2 protein [Quadrisphaera sp. KR29]|uniref:glycosyltransferase family 2 protein n=1 Tax=Quadrisphaera sp. KR29 TaxID=3461391 RepID=UPI004044F4FC